MINQFIHKQFLESLPIVSLKGFVLKIFVIFFSVSLITYFLQRPIIQFYKSQPYLNILGAVYPNIIGHLLYITFLIALFYKFNLTTLFKQLFSQKINKSLSLFLTTLVLVLLIPLLIRITGGLQIHPALNNVGSDQVIGQVIGKLFNPLVFLLLTVYFFIRAFIEEFIFRFVIFRFLRKKGFLVSIIISALLFSLLHQFGIRGSINTFIFGIIIALYYEYSNSFLRTAFLHALNNLVFATPIISLIEYYLLKL